MDFQTLTLVGLVAYGTVAVISWKFPLMDKGLKFGISFVIALAVTFVPAELAAGLAQNIKVALSAVLGMTAVGVLANKAGGK